MFTTPRSRPRRTRGLTALVAVLAVLTATAACGSSSSDSSSGGTKKFTVAYGAPVADHMVTVVAAKAGIFKKYGLDVTVKFLESAQLAPALVSGDVLFSTQPAPGPEVAAINGTKEVQVAQIQNSFNHVTVAGPQYTTVKSLDGKKVALSKIGAFSWLLAQMAQQKFGITLKEIPSGNQGDQVAAFISGQVDAIGAVSPDQVDAIKAKVPDLNIVEDWRTVKDVPALQVAGYAPELKKNHDTVVTFLKALNEGIAYFKDPANEQLIVPTIAKELGVSEAQAKIGWQNAIKALAPTIVPSESAQKNILPLLDKEFPGASKLDPASLIDASYAKEALGE